MAVNQFRRRLMAAGASPARASKMVEQRAFESGAPVGVPKSLPGAPLKLGDPYDTESQTASESYFPNAFRPPTVDSPEFKSYYDVVYGKGAYDKFGKDAFNKALSKSAPLYNSALRSSNPLDKIVVKALNDGMSLGSLQEQLLSKSVPGSSLTPQQMVDYAGKLYTEYGNAQQSVSDIYDKQIQKNQNYKYGLPDPRLRYGVTTSLGEGSIDVLTNAGAAKAYASYQQRTNDPKKLASFKLYLVNEINKAQRTPYKDELARREAFRGKKLGG